MVKKDTMRDSGIEFLKIGAMLAIVTYHVIFTLSTKNELLSYSGYVVQLGMATASIRDLFLDWLGYLGSFGNTLFFVCSAWFLLGSTRVKVRKCFGMICDNWVVSVGIMLVAVAMGVSVPKAFIARSFLPTMLGNNWYVTCYLLFYAIHPVLNRAIDSLDQRGLLRLVLGTSVLYLGIGFIKKGLFFASDIVVWIVIYFAIAYMRRYLMCYMDDVSLNCVVLLAGMSGVVGLMLLTNYLGLRIGYFSDKLLHWAVGCSPFIVSSSIALLNLARHWRFKSRVVNAVSACSLLVYIIHENLILRTFVRPWIINQLYLTYGYERIFLLVGGLSLATFAASLVAALLYRETLYRLVSHIGDVLYEWMRSRYLAFEKRALSVGVKSALSSCCLVEDASDE